MARAGGRCLTRLAVARLTGVFGIRGELKCNPTPVGENAIASGRAYALSPNEGARVVVCTQARSHKGRFVVAFEGVETVEAAQLLVGSDLYVERDEVELQPNEYLDRDLIGLQLRDVAGKELGRVAAVEHFPAQDCLVIEPGRALVPLVAAFVREIDLEARTIVMDLPAGLLEG
jgi:16S rRNA processing protein RimM